MGKCRLKYNGHYVKEDPDLEYLKECNKEESVFVTAVAEAIAKQCPEKIKLEPIEGE